MKNLSIAVPDSTFQRFIEIQNRKGFKNQSDCLIWVVDEAYKKLEKEASQE